MGSACHGVRKLMVHWDTPNYNPPKDRKKWRNPIIAVSLLVVAILAIIGTYPYLNPQTSVIPPPPPNSKICDTTVVNQCYNSQISSTQFGAIGLKWVNGANVNSYNNTVYPYQVWFNSTRGNIGIQFVTRGVSTLNVSLIRIYDLNMSSSCDTTINNCSTYQCLGQYDVCSVRAETLYFSTSVPLRGDWYELVFATSGVNSVWKFQAQ